MSIITTYTKGQISPIPDRYKELVRETEATAVSADTFPLSLKDDLGITKFKGISMAQVHTTDGSVVVDEPVLSTIVTDGVLTIAIGGTAVTGRRVYKILGE